MLAPTTANRLPFPWWRLRLFWLGALGLIFLLWCWGKSPVEGFSAYMKRDHPVAVAVGFQQYQGEVVMFGARDLCLSPGFQIHQTPLVRSLKHPEMHYISWGTPLWETPPLSYETIFLSYLLLWLGTLIWWQRRKAHFWCGRIS